MDKNEYILIGEKLPDDGEKVLAQFTGIYLDRKVTYWIDKGGNSHFGAIDELDGKGSQPATHWRKL